MDNNNNNNIPAQYKPISAWGYVGYQLLFNIPLVGFILLIIFAFDNENVNRKNFARSYFCAFLIAIIFIVIVLIIGASLGAFRDINIKY